MGWFFAEIWQDPEESWRSHKFFDFVFCLLTFTGQAWTFSKSQRRRQNQRIFGHYTSVFSPQRPLLSGRLSHTGNPSSARWGRECLANLPATIPRWGRECLPNLPPAIPPCSCISHFRGVLWTALYWGGRTDDPSVLSMGTRSSPKNPGAIEWQPLTAGISAFGCFADAPGF